MNLRMPFTRNHYYGTGSAKHSSFSYMTRALRALVCNCMTSCFAKPSSVIMISCKRYSCVLSLCSAYFSSTNLAESCKILQNLAESCRILQNLAKSCRILQNHAVLQSLAESCSLTEYWKSWNSDVSYSKMGPQLYFGSFNFLERCSAILFK